jgi:hypothetical protein
MAWLTPTDAGIAAQTGAHADVVGFDVDVIDTTGGREAAA